MNLARPISILALVSIVGCSLSDNPRDFRGRRSYHTRRATQALLGSQSDRVSDWDERLSTSAVTRTLLEADSSRAKRAEVVDKMAAAYILQGALDRMQNLQERTE